VEYETSSSEESQDKYDPAVSATLTMQHSEEGTGTGAGASVGGVPGTSSNVPSAKAGANKPATPNTGQFSKTDNNTYGVNKTTRHVIEPAGSIRRITAAVALDDATERKQQNGKWVEVRHKRPPEELQHISELAQAAIGFNSVRGDVISVENLTFDRTEAEDLPPATFIDQARKGLNDYSSVIRYAGLMVLFLFVYLLMIRPIQKRVLAMPNPLLAVVHTPALGATEAEAPLESQASLTLRNLTLKKQLAEFVRVEPESSTTAVRAWLREEAQ
jgi:flagellar M-ring protein FliF